MGHDTVSSQVDTNSSLWDIWLNLKHKAWEGEWVHKVVFLAAKKLKAHDKNVA